MRAVVRRTPDDQLFFDRLGRGGLLGRGCLVAAVFACWSCCRRRLSGRRLPARRLLGRGASKRLGLASIGRDQRGKLLDVPGESRRASSRSQRAASCAPRTRLPASGRVGSIAIAFSMIVSSAIRLLLSVGDRLHRLDHLGDRRQRQLLEIGGVGHRHVLAGDLRPPARRDSRRRWTMISEAT